MKKLLILGAGFYHRRIYQNLRRGGYYLVGVDRDPNAPASPLAHEFYAVDVTDVAAVVNLASEFTVDAVMPLNEFGMHAHAAAVEALGLLGNIPESANCAVDKELMRQRWAEWNLPQPRFAAFSSDGTFNLEEVRKAAVYVGFPCVIKPADSGGSGRGVLILNGLEDLTEGVDFARLFARNGRLLLESFIEGTEMTVEGLVLDGQHTILAASDKEKPPLRTRVAMSLNYPANFDKVVMKRVHELVHKAVNCLGLTHSATHTELIVTPKGEPILVEIGARGGGGHVFSDIVELVSGVDMPCALAEILCGGRPDLKHLDQYGACYRFFNPQPGVLREVRGMEAASNLPGVVDIGMFKRPGDRVGSLSNSLERAGFVITRGRNRGEAWDMANRVERTVEFIVTSEDKTG
jgi:biotin carboxylase